MRSLLFLSSLFATVIVVSGVVASPLRGDTLASASISIYELSCYYCSNPTVTSGSGSITGPNSASLGIELSNASASASYGSLSASVSISVPPNLVGRDDSGEATASFADTIMTSGSPITGTLRVELLGGGSLPLDIGNQNAGGCGFVTINLSTPSGVSTTFLGCSDTGPGLVFFPFTIGDSLAISAKADATVQWFSRTPGNGASTSASFQLGQLEFLPCAISDLSCRPLSGFGYESSSGSLYNFVGANPTPEPFTLSLLAIGSLGVVFRRKQVRATIERRQCRWSKSSIPSGFGSLNR